MSLPRQYGGLNFSMVPYVMAAEIVSRADAGFANIWGLQDCAETINEFASEEIKAEYLPRINKGETCSMDLTEPDAGSDLQAVMLRATYNEADGWWYLNGVKRFITNGDAEIKLVLARSEEGTSDGRGLSYFVCENHKDNAIKVRRIENKLGIKGSPTCELVFTNAKAKLVGTRRMGLIKYVMSLMNGARLGVGAQSVGLSQAAYNEAVAYAMDRRQFGKAIVEFPAVYDLLATIKAKLQASRAILYETTRFVDVYKAYEAIENERALTKEEKLEYKEYDTGEEALEALEKGEVDFTLMPTKSEYAKYNSDALLNLGPVYYHPMGIYLVSYSKVSEIEDCASIAIPDDEEGMARALLLLEANKYITLKEGAGLKAKLEDIVENKRNFEFKAVAHDKVASTDADIRIMGSLEASAAGYERGFDAFTSEQSDSEAAVEYAVILAIRKADLNTPEMDLVEKYFFTRRMYQAIDGSTDNIISPMFDLK